MIQDGPVTIGLILICFTVSTVVVSAFAYFVNRFQTKNEAEKSESDIKEWIRKVESDVGSLRGSMERILDNVSYIRGRIEPKHSKEE